MLAQKSTATTRQHAGAGVPQWRHGVRSDRQYVKYSTRGPAKDGSYVDELLAYTVGSVRYFVHNNHLFSPAAVTDGTGAVVERYAYDAYGTRTVTNAAGTVELATSSVSQSRGFTGYILDQETGLYHARARQYDSRLGRFISRDPSGYVDGLVLYAAFFAPNALDPSGLETYEECVKRALEAWRRCVEINREKYKAMLDDIQKAITDLENKKKGLVADNFSNPVDDMAGGAAAGGTAGPAGVGPGAVGGGIVWLLSGAAKAEQISKLLEEMNSDIQNKVAEGFGVIREWGEADQKCTEKYREDVEKCTKACPIRSENQ